MTCFVQYGPRYLKEERWEDLKETVIDRTIAKNRRNSLAAKATKEIEAATV